MGYYFWWPVLGDLSAHACTNPIHTNRPFPVDAATVGRHSPSDRQIKTRLHWVYVQRHRLPTVSDGSKCRVRIEVSTVRTGTEDQVGQLTLCDHYGLRSSTAEGSAEVGLTAGRADCTRRYQDRAWPWAERRTCRECSAVRRPVPGSSAPSADYSASQ